MINLPPLPEEQAHAHYEIKFIEILDDSKTGSRKFRTGALLQDEVEDWLKRTSASTEILNTKIIFTVPSRESHLPQQSDPPSPPTPETRSISFSNHGPPISPAPHRPSEEAPRLADQYDKWPEPRLNPRRASFQPTPVSDPVRQTINASMNLPPSYTRILHRGLGASLRFATHTGSEGFILQCRPVGDLHFSLAVTTHPSGIASHVFVHGLQEHEFVYTSESIGRPRVSPDFGASYSAFVLDRKKGRECSGRATGLRALSETDSTVS